MIGNFLGTALQIYFYAIFAWVVLSWIPMTPGHPLGRLQTGLDRIILPALNPIRRVVPPIRMGGGALDLSPIILLIGVQLLRSLLRNVF
ncbi:MAG: YggT family protein [Acidimicrobiia bacterium]